MFAPSAGTIDLACVDLQRVKDTDPAGFTREIEETTKVLMSTEAVCVTEEFVTGFYIGLKVAEFVVKSGGAL